MESSIKLYSLSYRDIRTYLFATVFVTGNILLPQLCHQFHLGGVIFLPIFFFTLIAAYKYGLWVGLITAIFSPLINHMWFGMPPTSILPSMVIESVLFAIGSAFFAHQYKKISLLAIFFAILFYQGIGSLIEWTMGGNLYVILNDLKLGIPGLLIQLFGGYLLLKSIQKI